jgi:hypothetical protein
MFNSVNKSVIKYIIYTIVVIGIISLLPRKKFVIGEYLFIVLPIIGLYIIFDSFGNIKAENFADIKSDKKKELSPKTLEKTKNIIQKITKSISNNIKRGVIKKPKVITPKVIVPKIITPKVVVPKVVVPKIVIPRAVTVNVMAPKVRTTKVRTPKVKKSKVITPKSTTSESSQSIIVKNKDKSKQVISKRKLQNIAYNINKLNVNKLYEKEKEAMNAARKLTKSKQLQRMKIALYNYIITNYSDDSNESQENRMLSFAKDKEFMKKLFIDNIGKPQKISESFSNLENVKLDRVVSNSIGAILNNINDTNNSKKVDVKFPTTNSVSNKKNPLPVAEISNDQKKRIMVAKAPTDEENRQLEKKYAAALSSSVSSENDWKYNQYNIKKMMPIGEGIQEWENDYALLNTDKWAPSFNPPPVCKNEKNMIEVKPNSKDGYAKNYTTLKDFNSSRKVMNPDNINIDFIKKLNKGK